MRITHGRAVLAVPRGSALGGYRDRVGGSTEVLDPITVDVIGFGTGDDAPLLVITGLICVNDDLTAAVRDRLGPHRPVWVSATHSHSSPETGCHPGGGPTPEPWLTGVPDAAARAYAGRTDLGPVGLTATPVAVTGLGGFRHRVEAVDLPVDLVTAHAPDGKLIMVLVVVPVHPTVLPATSRVVSGDLQAAIQRALARRLPGVRVITATGAAGDISTRPVRRGQDAAELERLGELTADQLVAVCGPTAEQVHTTDAYGAATDRVALTPASADERADLARRAEQSIDDHGDRTREVIRQGLRLNAESVSGPARPTELEIAAWAFDQVTLVAVAGEPYLDLRSQLRRDDHQRRVLLGYTNGYLGYLPSVAGAHEPTYECLSSPIGPTGAAELIIAVAAVAESAERILPTQQEGPS